MSKLLIAMIQFYKKHFSPHLGANCRFVPTCSEYTMEAIETHGAFMGLLFGFFRILRCNPFCKGGYDPVPPKRTRLKK
ncbi:MAG: membrane protein insertion efficiency factor YidD [Oscillospiraceae bacterium]